MEELSYVFTLFFVSCVHVRLYFSPLLIFTLLAASISHFLTAALNFHVFLPMKFVSLVLSPGGGGGGTAIWWARKLCAVVKGMVFKQFTLG